MFVFFLILTLGFAYELGKNALKIENRQTYGIKQNITEIVSLCRNNPPKPHLSVALPLKSMLNLLNTDKYIISPALQNVLQSGKVSLPDASLDTKNKYPKGLYLIMFKVINLDSRVLFYNYIHFHDIFLPVLINYMYNRVNICDSIIQEEWGDFLVFFDDKLMLNPDVKEYADMLNNIDISDSLVTDTGSINFINKLTGLCNNETIYSIINLAYNKDHKHSDLLFNKIKNSKTVGGLNDKLPNLIDGCL
jgi:NADH:ubiquinone oxidoreductase subunit 3 (subunit A)